MNFSITVIHSTNIEVFFMSGIVNVRHCSRHADYVSEPKKKLKNPCLHGAYFKIRLILIIESN